MLFKVRNVGKRIYQTGVYWNKSRLFSKSTKSVLADFILRHTECTSEHLTPEISLNLITSACALWHGRGDSGPFTDPFWAFYWPGGQALSRYILDNKSQFRNKYILDVGSGCGASAIACKIAGATKVVANDIDYVAVEAMKINAETNKVYLEICSEDMIGQKGPWDTLLFGDMFYDPEFAETISIWLDSLGSNREIYIGDPGRLPFINSSLKSKFELVAEYALPEQCLKENFGQSVGCVWRTKK